MSLSDRLKQLRNEKGITQSQLAVEFNKGEAAIRTWETGKAKPDCDTLIKLAEYFGVSLDYLCGLSNIRVHEEAQKDKLINEMTDKIIEYENRLMLMRGLVDNQLLPGLAGLER